MRKKVLILGAGLAGLSAGWKLSEWGYEIEVFEAEPQVGGLAKSYHHGEFIIDTGPHRFWSKQTRIIQEIEELLGRGNFLTLRRKSRIYVNGNFIEYPVTVRSILQMPSLTALKAMGEYALQYLKRHLSQNSNEAFEHYVRNHFGHTLYRLFFGDYTKKLLGISPTILSSDWARQRIPFLGLKRAICDAFNNNKKTWSDHGNIFRYPRRGIGDISEAMKVKIQKNGGRVWLNSPITRVLLHQNYVEIACLNDLKHEQSHIGDCVISTIPITCLVKFLIPKPPISILMTAKQLKYRSIIFLYLFFTNENITEDNWLYFPEKEIIFNRISEAKMFSKEMSPLSHTSFCVEITCNKDDYLWHSDLDDLKNKALETLKNTKLIKEDTTVTAFMAKEPYAYPIYILGYNNVLNSLFNYLYQYDQLISIGRQGLFRYNNMDHSIDMGIKAAQWIHTYQNSAERDKIKQQIYFD
ncbi:MAG: FAD-dependent oxidoreductase [bacterium]